MAVHSFDGPQHRPERFAMVGARQAIRAPDGFDLAGLAPLPGGRDACLSYPLTEREAHFVSCRAR